MKTSFKRTQIGMLAAVALTACTLASGTVLANGTETLGEPSIDITAGSGVVASGTGLVDQPGYIMLDVPGSVKQTLLYWEGRRSGTGPGDDTIMVGGNSVLGEIIGGPAFFIGTSYSTVYRADITDLNLITKGANSVLVEGFDVSRPHGAGIMVVYNDGTTGDITLKDGVDIVYSQFTDERQTAVAQELKVAASSHERMARLNLFISSVRGTLSGGDFRPSAIDVTINGVTETYNNLLDSVNGEEWDTVSLDIVIPAGVDTVTVTPRSVDNLGLGGDTASMSWIAASLSVKADKTCHTSGYSGHKHGHKNSHKRKTHSYKSYKRSHKHNRHAYTPKKHSYTPKKQTYKAKTYSYSNNNWFKHSSSSKSSSTSSNSHSYKYSFFSKWFR